MPSRSWRRVILFRLHVHAHFHSVVAATQNYTAYRTDISIIPAPGERNVTLERDHVVGRIDVQPTGTGAIGGNPGMRSIRAHQPRMPRRRVGSEVSANVPGGQA